MPADPRSDPAARRVTPPSGRFPRRALLAGLGALALGAGPAAAAEPNLLPRLGETRAPTADEAFWRPGAEPLPLESYWRRMAELTAIPAFARVAPLVAEERADRLFGICNALAGEDAVAPLMRGVGASIDRVELRWDEVEPLPGERRWARFDRLFDAAERWGLSVLPVLIGAPHWAVGDAADAGAGPPTDWPAWQRFAADAAARYGGRVAAWEVWNEPNIREFWRGTVDQYARLLRLAYPSLSRTAPVLLGGMVQDDGSWLRALVRAEAPFDAVAWHVYGDAAELLRLAPLTRSLTDRPIWVTEAGASILPLYALARAVGVERLMLYRASDVGDHLWGLLREDLAPKPSFLAYRAAARWLGGRAFVRLHSPTHVELDGAHVTWGAPIALPPGQHLLVYPSGASILSRSGPPASVPVVVVTGAGSATG
jgi:hypothetical protein